jgi:hypothetical protein
LVHATRFALVLRSFLGNAARGFIQFDVSFLGFANVSHRFGFAFARASVTYISEITEMTARTGFWV